MKACIICCQIRFIRLTAVCHPQVFCEAQRTSPSVLYLPEVQQWWETAGPSLKLCFSSLLLTIPSFCPVLLLATCSVPYSKLDSEVSSHPLFHSFAYSLSLNIAFNLSLGSGFFP